MKKNVLLVLALFITVLFGYGQVLQQDFQAAGPDIPASWAETGVSTDGIWSVGDAAAASSEYMTFGAHTNFAYTNDDDCNCDKSADRLITPSMDVSSYTALQMTYDYLFYTFGGSFTVEVSTDGGSSWTVVATGTSDAAWQDDNLIDLTAYAGESDLQISFLYNDGGSWNYGAGVDNVVVGAPSACLQPTVLTATNITDTSADLSWTAGDSETEWNVVYGAPTFDPDLATPINVTPDANTTLSELIEGTDYEFYVQADCDGDESDWAGPYAFTTLIACPTGDIIFTTQAQIDDFGATYGHCTEISGNLEIGPFGDITNLNGLSSLTSIQGGLRIYQNNNLSSLNGLSSLESIGGYFQIFENHILTNLEGLSSLTSIGEFLVINYNYQLENLDGLSSLTSIGEDLFIISNYHLANLGDLSALTSIGGDLDIDGNPELANLSGLSSLTSIGGNLEIYSNSVLASLSGLVSLESIGRHLYIVANVALTDISGLENISPTSIDGGLNIYNNINLEVCNLPNFCTYLAGSGHRTIFGNKSTCYDEAAVIAACNPLAECPTGDFTFTTQAEIDAFGAIYSHCTDITLGNVVIEDSDITNLDGLANLTNIEGELNIKFNEDLSNIDGLANLTRIVEGLNIESNSALTNLDGLENLTSIDGYLEIYNNSQLTNIEGLAGLTSIGEYLGVVENSQLTNIDGLASLTTIGGYIEIYENIQLVNLNGLANVTSIGEEFDIIGNSALTNLDGLANITSINGYLDIRSNDALANFDGLSNLTSISGFLSIVDNSQLVNLDWLSNLTNIGGALNVYGNSQLANLDGLADLASIGRYLYIGYNSALANLDGLASVTSINESLEIISNPVLTNLDGLSNLINVNGYIKISENDQLNDISGLKNIDPSSIRIYYGLSIIDNVNLSVCNLPNFCTYLSDPSNTRNISGNLVQCVNEAAVIAACNEGELIPDSNNILYVNKNVSGGDGTGDSWTNAVPELADALVWAKLHEDVSWEISPLQIYVATGTYKPLYSPEDGLNFGTDQGRNNSFSMVKNVQIYGGFDPDNGISTLAHSRILPQLGNAGSILSGDIGMENDVSDNAYNVIVSCGEMGTAILDGFAITEGNANTYSDIFINAYQVYKCSGSGIYNSESSPSYKNLVLYNNSCTESGGGMFSYKSSPNLQHVVFKNNQAKDGGGMANQQNSSPTLLNVSIESNMASENGSAMYNVDQSGPILTNVSIAGNEASVNSEVEIPGCASLNSGVTFSNSIIWDIVSGDYSAQNSLIQGNSDTSNGNIDSSGLVDTDIFTDPTNGDFTLQATSPGINLGDNEAYATAGGDLDNDIDLAGNPRVYVGASNPNVIDIGAYEFQGEPGFPTDYFITTWKTDNSGTSNSSSITIPTTGGGYNYDVSWNNDGVWETGFTGNATHDYGTAGTYTVAIRGSFPRIFFNNVGDKSKIRSIEQWGATVWRSMSMAFTGCENLVGNATDMPNLSLVTDMEGMFAYARKFNGDLNFGNWDVSNITNMRGMFGGASIFNKNIGGWDVSNVTNMDQMFNGATLFNQNIGSWNVGNVTNMNAMFRTAMKFNQNIGAWNMANVTTMSAMFAYATNLTKTLEIGT